jgi:AAA+ superfamily predicted ATPase
LSNNGIAFSCSLPNPKFDRAWEAIKIPDEVRTRLIAQALLCLSIRQKIPFDTAPLHGFILLSGPPGTGKTTLARGLASQTAKALPNGKTQFIQVDPHNLASSALGKSQQEATKLFQQTIPEAGANGACIVLLDEVETLAVDRQQLSMEANPIDVHRATDAVLAGIDLLTRENKNILIIATTNFPKAVDGALISRADMVQEIGLPGSEARKMILEDLIKEFSKHWPDISKLTSHLEEFTTASKGLDGRRIRKAYIEAATESIGMAKDLNKLSASAILNTFKKAQTKITKKLL